MVRQFEPSISWQATYSHLNTSWKSYPPHTSFCPYWNLPWLYVSYSALRYLTYQIFITWMDYRLMFLQIIPSPLHALSKPPYFTSFFHKGSFFSILTSGTYRLFSFNRAVNRPPFISLTNGGCRNCYCRTRGYSIKLSPPFLSYPSYLLSPPLLPFLVTHLYSY